MGGGGISRMLCDEVAAQIRKVTAFTSTEVVQHERNSGRFRTGVITRRNHCYWPLGTEHDRVAK